MSTGPNYIGVTILIPLSVFTVLYIISRTNTQAIVSLVLSVAVYIAIKAHFQDNYLCVSTDFQNSEDYLSCFWDQQLDIFGAVPEVYFVWLLYVSAIKLFVSLNHPLLRARLFRFHYLGAIGMFFILGLIARASSQ